MAVRLKTLNLQYATVFWKRKIINIAFARFFSVILNSDHLIKDKLEAGFDMNVEKIIQWAKSGSKMSREYFSFKRWGDAVELVLIDNIVYKDKNLRHSSKHPINLLRYSTKKYNQQTHDAF